MKITIDLPRQSIPQLIRSLENERDKDSKNLHWKRQLNDLIAQTKTQLIEKTQPDQIVNHPKKVKA